MVQIDIPIAMGVGFLLADAASKQLQTKKKIYYYQTLWINNLCLSLISLFLLYFILNYFGWETTHMWWHRDSVTAYPYFVPIFMGLFFLASNGGFWLGSSLVKNGHTTANRIIHIIIFACSGMWIFVQANNTFRLGSYTEWKAGNAPWFYQDSTFLFMLMLALTFSGIALTTSILILRREGKKIDP